MQRPAPLGKLLVDAGVLTAEALDEVLSVQRNDKRRLGELLVDKKLVRADQLAQILSRQLSCPWVSLGKADIAESVIKLVPKRVAADYRLVPVYVRHPSEKAGKSETKTLYVATDDPTDVDAINECEFATGMKVRAMVAVTSELMAALSRFYGVGEPPKRVSKPPAPPPPRVPPSAASPGTTAANAGGGAGAIAQTPSAPSVRAARPAERGATFEGRYELVRELWSAPGESRWLVVHRVTRKKAVLLTPAQGAEDDGAGNVRIGRARSALARLSPPFVLDVRDGGETATGTPYLVLEHAEGRSLDGLLAARERLEPRAVTAAFRQVADGLDEAHRAGVAHQHVRLGDLLVARDAHGVERVRLLDWSHAVTADGGDGADGARGAPLGEEAIASDVQAVGACMFHALSGRALAHGEDVEVALEDAQVGPMLAAVVARAVLEEGPGRFSNMAELRAALDAVDPTARAATSFLAARLRTRPSQTTEATAAAAEARRFARVPYRAPVRVACAGFPTFTAQCEDISEGGLLAVTPTPLARGVEVSLDLALPGDGRIVTQRAVVRWSHGTNGSAAAGFELLELPEDAKAQIRAYVATIVRA